MKNVAGIEKEGLGSSVLDQQAMVEGATQAGIGIIMVLAALIGVWGIACLVGGVMEVGVTELMRGFVTAVTGN